MSEEETWRSETAYEYIDTLTPSELAWEFLRRNPDYRTAFQRLLSTGRLTDDAATAFAQQWGLCFRRKPTNHGARAGDLLDPASRSRCDHPPKRSRPARRFSSHR